MKLAPLLILLVGASASAIASGVCERVPLDPELPAGIGGSYEIIGKDPATGNTYTGTLVLGYDKSSYRLIRTTQGNAANGDAWIESCGMDKIKMLVARYYTKPVTEVTCALDADGGNYYRTTCRTRQGGRQWRGLEAWFQRP